MLREHRTKAATWGKIIVTQGSLRYRILTDPVEEHVLGPDHPGIVEPEMPHEVALLDDDTQFYVEFYARGP